MPKLAPADLFLRTPGPPSAARRRLLNPSQPRAMAAPESKQARLTALVAEINGKFPEVPTISARELRCMLQGPQASSVVVVDVRTSEEVGVSTIPGTLTAADLTEERKAELRGAGVLVVPFCTVGYRSAQFCRWLQKEGLRTRNLEGSILAWTQEGYELVTGPAQEATARVHVFGKQWALQGEGYEPVMFKQPMVSLAVSALRGVLPARLGGTPRGGA